MSYSLLNGGDSFYARKEWSEAICAALDEGLVESEILQTTHRLCMRMAEWPTLNKMLRQLLAMPRPVTEDAYNLALDIIERTTSIAKALAEGDRDKLGACEARGEIRRCPDPNSPFGSYYEFSDLSRAQPFVYWAMSALAINRIRAEAMMVVGMADPDMDIQNRRLSLRIWCSYPYLSRHQGVASMTFAFPLAISFEEATEVERPHVIDMINTLEGGSEKSTEKWNEESTMASVLFLTGRMPMTSRQGLAVGLRSETLGRY